MELEERKLFIKGILEETTEKTLTDHFSNYGEVNDCLKIRDRGIGYVTFANSAMAKNALEDEHIILGKKVNVKPARPIEVKERKVFVGGLAPDITLEEFQTYFGSYGRITDAVLIHDKITRKFRGFGFVTYESEEAANNVLAQNFHKLKNKSAEVKMAKPKLNEKTVGMGWRSDLEGGSWVSIPSSYDEFGLDIYRVENQPNYIDQHGVGSQVYVCQRCNRSSVNYGHYSQFYVCCNCAYFTY